MEENIVEFLNVEELIIQLNDVYKGYDIDLEVKDKLVNHYFELKNKNKDLDDLVEDLNMRISSILSENVDLNNKVERLKNKNQELLSQVDELEEDIKELEDDKEELQERVEKLEIETLCSPLKNSFYPISLDDEMKSEVLEKNWSKFSLSQLDNFINNL